MAARFDSGSFESYGAVQSTGAGVTVPDAALLFKGDYARSGTDLVISGPDGQKFVVTEYFLSDSPPNLVSPGGAMLTGETVTSLAGPQFPAMYAQAGNGTMSGAKEIGKVQSVEGSATVVRKNGVTETLKAGDAVFEGDVVLTGPGSKLGIGFVDGTVFSMNANARMVLNKLVYNPEGTDNSMLFSLVEGTFVFAAGKIAPTGDMKFTTPVATMGIRGTSGIVEIEAANGPTKYKLIPDPRDGHEGAYVLYDLATGQPIATVNSTGSVWRVTDANGNFSELPKDSDDLLADAQAISQIGQVYNSWTNSPDGPQAGPNNSPPSSSGGFNDPPPAGNIDGNQGGTPPGGENDPPPEGPPPGEQGNLGPPADLDDLPPLDQIPEDEGVTIIVGTEEDDDDTAGDDGAVNPSLTGTPGDDVISGLAGDDDIDALGGNDIIDAGLGNDDVDAGPGNDTVIVSANEADIYDGGDGTDTLLIEGDLDLSTKTILFEADNFEIVDLNKTHTNELTLTAEDIAGANAGATLTFLGGENSEGDDDAELENDTLNLSPEFFVEIDGVPVPVIGAWFEVSNAGGFATYEFVEIDPETGDPIDPDAVLATAIVEDGIDVVVGETVVGEDNPELGDNLEGTIGPDFVLALDGDDSIVAGHGNGDDTYIGGAGIDALTFYSAVNGVIINLADGTVQGVDVGFDTFSSIEMFFTGGGDDTLVIGDITLPDNFVWDAGGGNDTVLFDGALNVDTAQFDGEIDNIETIDLNKTHANVFTISVDDFIRGEDEENSQNMFQIRGGATDVVNLTNLINLDLERDIETNINFEVFNVAPFSALAVYDEGPWGPYYEGTWIKSDDTFTADDGTIFDIYEFWESDSSEPLAVAQIEQGIEVNFLIESFENGFDPNGWNIIGPASITTDMSTERDSAALLTTTTGNEDDAPDGTGDSEDEQPDPRKNVLEIAELLEVELGDLDALADSDGESGFVIEGSAIQTTFYAMAGQTISFDWFFSTFEYLELPEGEFAAFGPPGGEFVNDIAFVVIDGEIFKLFDAESTGNTMGNVGTEGWNGFSTVLTESGEHTIGFGVLDNEDDEVETNLNIDNIRLGPATVQSGAFAAAVMMFDVGSNQFPQSYTEAGMTVESQYVGSGDHIHLQSNALNNHSGCCSSPYHFALTDGGTFSFLGFDLTQVSVTGGIWTSSKGGVVDLTGASTGNFDFSSDPLFQDVEWVEWAQPQGSSTIDNVTFSGGSASRMVVTGTEQDDLLFGQEFADVLLGLGGDDNMNGQDGNDILDGGSGNNTLTGGEGADKFVIAGLNDGIDTVTDFGPLDSLDLTGLLESVFDPASDDIDDFVKTSTENGDTTVSVDLDGTGSGSPVDIAVLQGVGLGAGINVAIGEDNHVVNDVNV